MTFTGLRRPKAGRSGPTDHPGGGRHSLIQPERRRELDLDLDSGKKVSLFLVRTTSMTGRKWDSGHPLQKVCFRWGWPGEYILADWKKKFRFCNQKKKKNVCCFLIRKNKSEKNWPPFWSLAGQETNIFVDGLT